MLNVLIGLIGLGLVVFLHELGHLIAAKANGVTVEAFSVGWGTLRSGPSPGAERTIESAGFLLEATAK
jgi:membrane-associated protease RseP (regulator of RpoE activity)